MGCEERCHEARVVAAVRDRTASRRADRCHRGRGTRRDAAHDPRERRGVSRLRAHAGLAPSQSDGLRGRASPMTPMLIVYGALALPYVAAIVRLALASSHWTRLLM